MPECHYIIDAPAAVQPLLRRALQDLGLHETGPNIVPGLSDGQPWCAKWCSRVLVECGVPVEPSDSALTLLKHLGPWSIDHAGELLPGDVIGWDRSEPGEGHVGMVLRVHGDVIHFLSGNSGPGSESVAITYPTRDRVRYAGRPVR